MTLPIDADEGTYLRRAMVALVATQSARNRPFLTPLWFVVDRGALYLGTGTESWAARNIRHHPEVTLLFGGEPGLPADRFLRLRGSATVHSGMPAPRLLLRLALKYYLPPRALLVEWRHRAQWPLRSRYYAANRGHAGYLEVRPSASDFVPGTPIS